MTGQEQGTSRLWAKTASAATEEIFRLRTINTDLLAALKVAREIAASRADPEHCMHYGEINWTQVRDEFGAAIARAK